VRNIEHEDPVGAAEACAPLYSSLLKTFKENKRLNSPTLLTYANLRPEIAVEQMSVQELAEILQNPAMLDEVREAGAGQTSLNAASDDRLVAHVSLPESSLTQCHYVCSACHVGNFHSDRRGLHLAYLKITI
jgi:hypothetical protein